MDAGIVILGLWVLLGPTFIGIWAIVSVSKLKARIRALEKRDYLPDNSVSSAKKPISQPSKVYDTPEQAPEPTESVTITYDIPQASIVKPAPSDPVADETTIEESVVDNTLSDKPSQDSPVPAPNDWLSRAWQGFKANWLVWIGGLAMVIGMGYLVQVIGSNFTIAPMVRVSIAALISLAVVALGEYLHSKRLDGLHFAYIPATVSAAGMSGLYGTVLFAYIGYELIGPSSTMLMLAVIAWVSIGLTLRQGPLMAALGLIAGYIAPFWITSNEPNLWLLAGYLLSITLAGIIVSQRVNRLWLSWFYWPAQCAWLALIASESTLIAALLLPVVYYLVALVPRQGWWLKSDNSPPFWHHPSLIICAAVAGSALVVSITNADQLLWFSWALAAAVFLPAAVKGFSSQLISLDSVIFASIWTLLVLVFAEPSWQVILLPLLVWCRITLQAHHRALHIIVHWFSIFWLPVALSALYLSDILVTSWPLIASIALIASLLAAYYVANVKQAQLSSAHILVALLSYFTLPGGLFVAAIALQVACLAWLVAKQNWQPATWLTKAAMLLISTLFTIAPFINEWQLDQLGGYVLLGSAVVAFLLMGRYWLNEHPMRTWYTGAVLHVIAVWLLVLGQLWLNTTDSNLFARLALGTTQAVLLSALYWWRSGMNVLYRYYSQLLLVMSGLLLVAVTTVQLPYFEHPLQGWRILNWMLFAYLVPAVVFGLQAKLGIIVEPLKQRFYAIAALVLAALWVNLAVRNLWQGQNMAHWYGMSNGELYTYSFVWLLCGLVLTTWAVMQRNQLLQNAGLAILALVSVKVFVIDASELTGVLRAVSFLGLGSALVAIGWLFQRLRQAY